MPEPIQEEHGRSNLPQQLEEEPRDPELVGPTEPIREASSRIAAAMLGEASPSTREHSEDVVLVAAELCDRLGLGGEERANVLVAARLHDVGKISVPRDVLDKPGPLTNAEWALVKEHTVTGERILRSISELVPAAALVRHSHEHFDGSGYPDRLSGDEIPLGSRIILCADAFHAIRSDRPYRKGRTTKRALKEMRRCAGSQFDPAVVDALLRSASSAPRSARGIRMSRRLALLLAMLTLGGGGAYAAERGWIPSPVPGLGPDRSGEVAAVQAGLDDPAAWARWREAAIATAGGSVDGLPISKSAKRSSQSRRAKHERKREASVEPAPSALAPLADAVPPAPPVVSSPAVPVVAGSSVAPVETQNVGAGPGLTPAAPIAGSEQGDPKPGEDGKDEGGSNPGKGKGQGSSKPGKANGKGESKPGKGGKGESKPGKGSGGTQAGSKPGKGNGGGKGDPKPGKGEGAAAGEGGSKPGKTPPVEGNTPPGQTGTPPGHGGTPPGQSGVAPGNDAPPPHQDAISPTQRALPPEPDAAADDAVPDAAAASAG